MPESVPESLCSLRKQFLAFVRRRVHDPDLAEDILQSAYMQALRTASQPRSQNSARAWFYRILRNAVVDWYRSRAAESGALERLGRELSSDTEPVSSAPATSCGCLETAIAALNERYASVLREVDLGETTTSRYAASRGITPGNAAVRAHRARAALRSQLLRCCGDCAVRGCVDCTCAA